MHLKLKAFGLVAGLAMCLGVAGPAFADNSTTTSLQVSTTDTGSFGIQFQSASLNFGSVNTSGLNLDTAYDLPGSVGMIITDTQTYRAAFNVSVVSSNFNGYYNPALGITASNLKITAVYNPEQTRYSSGNGGGVGDVGLADQNGGGNHGSQLNGVPYGWTGNNTLEQSRVVALAKAGTGTIATGQRLDLSIHIPRAQQADTYVATLTATVLFGVAP